MITFSSFYNKAFVVGPISVVNRYPRLTNVQATFYDAKPQRHIVEHDKKFLQNPLW